MGWPPARASPCKPCPTSQVASRAANPFALPLPAPSPAFGPAPSSSGEAARPSRPHAAASASGPPLLRGHHAPAQAWRLTRRGHYLSSPPPPAGPQGKHRGPPFQAQGMGAPIPTLPNVHLPTVGFPGTPRVGSQASLQGPRSSSHLLLRLRDGALGLLFPQTQESGSLHLSSHIPRSSEPPNPSFRRT